MWLMRIAGIALVGYVFATNMTDTPTGPSADLAFAYIGSLLVWTFVSFIHPLWAWYAPVLTVAGLIPAVWFGNVPAIIGVLVLGAALVMWRRRVLAAG